MDSINRSDITVMKKLSSAALALVCCLLAHPAGAQTYYYWDNNGLATPTGGTWDTATPAWSTSSAGVDSGSLVAFPAGGLPVFCAGATTAGPIEVDVNTPNLSVNGVYNNGIGGTPCALTLGGSGSLSLPAGLNTFYVSSAASNTTVNIPINGTGGLQTGGSGNLYLYSPTGSGYSGGTMLASAALTYFNNNNAFGTGTITPALTGSPGYAALLSSGGSTITLPNNFVISTANAGINFASSASTPVVCTGTWDLQQTLYLRNNGNSTAPLTLSGIISDVGGLTISANNSGTTLLSGANSYSGGTSIIQGSSGHTVQLGNASALGTGAATVASGCVLDLNGTTGVNINNTLTVNGTGVSSGGALLNSSTSTAASISSTTPVALGGTSQVFIGGTANGTYDITINGVVSGGSSAPLVMVGKNQGTTLASWTGVHIPTLTLNGVNTSFLGGLTIDYSTVAVGNASAVGTGTLNLNDFPATFQSTPGASPLTFNNALTLGASAPGTVPAQTPACIFGGAGTANLIFSGNANSGTSNNKTVSADNITVTFSGVISGATTSKFIGWAGGNALTAGPGTIVLAGANTYTKTNILCSGTVQVAYAETAGTSGPLGKSAAANAGNIVFNGGTLQYSSANHNDYSGRFSTVSGQVYNTGGQLYNIDVNGQSVTFATGLNSAGAGALTLSDTAGGGTLKLSAANSYTGGTTINAGTLEVSGSIAGNVTVNGGVLKLDNTTALASGATLTLPGTPSASQVNLNLSGGTQNISALYFGTTQMAAGTWGASGAQHNNAAFTGSGLLNVASGPQPTIAITSITPNPVCSGATASLTATVTGGNPNSAPSGTVQFYNGVTSLGTQPLLSGTATLTGVSLPAGTYANITAQYSGDNYNNTATSTAASPSLVVNPLPTTSAISGNSSVCAGAAGVNYSVTLTSGSSYAWMVPSGATITAGSSGPNNNQITVTFGSTGGNVAVTETSAAGCAGSQVTEAVTVNNCAPPNITNIVVNLDGSYSLICTGVLNTPYWLKASSDVTVPLPWTTLPSQNGTILSSPFTLSDGPSGLPAQRFYYLTNNAN